ncbi:TPR_11 domain-containing protein [Cephalotus follicularis]|uniref:TPR_11 domain-containing protein n=1 Tax=Cephalotus follicularis TaxID=3775 RepID=A0A1Q3CVM0_CEPFO|nr:TPR_11 domain-containing protein [Cephalotus follicularis]
MALWMESGSEPKTESEIADLQAITALKHSAAVELKEKGNQYVKMGKKHYNEAIDCYTRAINQNVLSDYDTSILFANRAHVNLLLGNHRRALIDSEDAVKLCPTNLKALYRAAKAALSLMLLTEAKSFCYKGLEKDPDNDDLKKLVSQIDALKLEQEQRQALVSRAVAEAKELVFAIEERGLKIGKAVYQELTGLRKPILDKDKILHWPVLLLYAEVMTSDFIENFCETDLFSAHLDIMLSEGCPPLQWDRENHYTRENIELYYEAGPGICLSKTELLCYLLEGTAGANAKSIGDEDKDDSEGSNHGFSAGEGSSKWVKVNDRRNLQDVLKEPNFIIPGIPVFYAVSKSSSFYEEFKAGKWVPPQ